MKKLGLITISVITLSVVFIMTAPPGHEIIDDYTNTKISSKDNFRSRKNFDYDSTSYDRGGSGGSGGSDSNNSQSTGAYVERPVPDDLSKESLQAWLNTLSLCPQRRAIIQFEIDCMGLVPYHYGGDGRGRYKQDISTWGNGQDCSGMVTAAYFRGGVDFGWCFSTTTIAQTFGAYQVSELMPGDISVVSGKHTEIYLGKQADGTWVHIGVRDPKAPPGPDAIRNHAYLIGTGAIHVRPPQLAEFDKQYYASGGGSGSNANSGYSASEFATGDGGVNQILPEVKEIEEELLKKCAESGYDVKIVCDIRTVEEQNRLYAQGRTSRGSIVTNANGSSYESYHQWGLAFDFCHKTLGYNVDDSFWLGVGAIGKSLGLEWGGDWTSFVDRPHLQLSKYGSNVGALKQKYGTPENMFKQILGE